MTLLFVVIPIVCFVTSLIAVILLPRLILGERTIKTNVTTEVIRPSDFPEYTGRDAREVFIEFQLKYPQYRLVIVRSWDQRYIQSLDQRFDENRVRMYVTRTRRVERMYIG